MTSPLTRTLRRIRRCRLCETQLPLGPRPVLQAAAQARILIASQAPGRKVHESGRPFADASGDRLRDWLGMSAEQFYDEQLVAIVPMGFCYPGKAQSGDLPPRPECAALWHGKLNAQLQDVGLTLLVGRYAQTHYLGDRRRSTLSDTVRAWKEYLPLGHFPLPHPSPRNHAWFARNPWFAEHVLPAVRTAIRSLGP